MKDKATEMESDGVVTNETHTDKIRATNRLMIKVFERECPEFLSWISMLTRFGGNPVDAMMLRESPGDNGSVYKAEFFTERFEYTVTARLGENAEKPHDSYLGAVVSNRKPCAGEDWTRGSDLGDGSCDEDVWIRIMADIISHEMVRLGK